MFGSAVARRTGAGAVARKRNVLLRLTVAGAIMISTLGSATAAQASAAAGWCPTAVPAVPPAGSLKNVSTVGIGVFHLADGACGLGNYDTVLPSNQDTYHYQPIRWSEVAGAYVGPEYNATVTLPGVRAYSYSGPVWILDPWRYGGNWQIKVVRK